MGVSNTTCGPGLAISSRTILLVHWLARRVVRPETDPQDFVFEPSFGSVPAAGTIEASREVHHHVRSGDLVERWVGAHEPIPGSGLLVAAEVVQLHILQCMYGFLETDQSIKQAVQPPHNLRGFSSTWSR